MFRMRPAPFAVLRQFDFARDELAILARPVIGATALLTRYFYELVLRHETTLYPARSDWSSFWNERNVRVTISRPNLIAKLIPREQSLECAVDHNAHQRIDNEPSAQDKEKPQKDIDEGFARRRCNVEIAHVGEVANAGPRKENGRHDNCNEYREVEYVSRELRKRAEGAFCSSFGPPAVLRNKRFGKALALYNKRRTCTNNYECDDKQNRVPADRYRVKNCNTPKNAAY